MKEFRPISRIQAQDFVRQNHRHNNPPIADIFRIGLFDDDRLIGVGIAGRPIARHQCNGTSIEVTRVCVLDGYKNACSQIYSRMKRIAQLMGYRRVITYTHDSESGASLRAIGAKVDHKVKKGTWLNRQNRSWSDDEPKQMWLL